MRDVAVVGFAQRQMPRVRRVADLCRAARPGLHRVLRADRLDPQATSGSGAPAPRTTWPAGRSRSSRRSTRSASSRRSTSRTSRWTLAWAMYEAWMKIQTGEVDTALVYGFGKSSAGVLRRMLALQLDPYTLTPLWPDTVSLAGTAGPRRHRRRAVGRAGHGRGGQPLAAPTRRRTSTPSGRAARRSTSCSPGRCTPTRCASTTAPRSPTARPPSCSPPATGPARCATGRPGSPASPHYVDPMGLGAARPDPVARPPSGPAPRSTSTGVEVAELHAPFSHQELILRRELGLADDVAINPSGGALAGNPMFTGGADPRRRGGRGGSGPARPTKVLAHATRGPALQQNLVCTMAASTGATRSRELMGKQPAAVIGVGQTHHRAKREDVSMAGLCREAIDRALADANMSLRRHRRDRGRQGAGPVRGRDDARAVPGRGARRGRQAAAAGAHRRLGGRLDRDRGLLAGAGRRAQAGADGRLREAVGVQRDVGAVGAAAVQHAGARRRRRLLRPARALLHPPLRTRRPTSARSWRPRTGRTR